MTLCSLCVWFKFEACACEIYVPLFLPREVLVLPQRAHQTVRKCPCACGSVEKCVFTYFYMFFSLLTLSFLAWLDCGRCGAGAAAACTRTLHTRGRRLVHRSGNHFVSSSHMHTHTHTPTHTCIHTCHMHTHTCTHTCVKGYKSAWVTPCFWMCMHAFVVWNGMHY